MIIKQLAALAVLALTLSGCAPLPIGAAAGGATALVVTDPHWCKEVAPIAFAAREGDSGADIRRRQSVSET